MLTFNIFSLLPYSGIGQQKLIQQLWGQLSGTDEPENAGAHLGRALPAISFIIPAYNAASFLHEAVESIASTGYPDPEVIIVDDGSTDETARVVASLALECCYLHQPNSGVSAARNKGLAASTGELIVFLDADDLLNPPALFSLLNTLMSNPDAIAVTGFAQKFQTGSNSNKICIGSPAESYPWYVGAALFRKTAFEKNGLFDEELRYSEDTDWFIRARENSLAVIRAPEISLFVRRHQQNISRDKSLNQLQVLTVLRKKIGRASHNFSSSRNMSTP